MSSSVFKAQLFVISRQGAGDVYFTLQVRKGGRIIEEGVHEIKRISDDSDTILSELANRNGLTVYDKNFNRIIGKTLEISWARDPFDRLIVATASLEESLLITKGGGILNEFGSLIPGKLSDN